MRAFRIFPIATGMLIVPALIASTTQRAAAQDSTASLHYKGVTLAPVGYFAAEGVWRQRNITADIGSSFNAIPFSGTTNAGLSEMRLSGRQSRIGVLATANAGTTKFTGLWESDFLGVGTSSNNNESNSYTLRLRQFWGSAALQRGWTVSAGQMWSLLTAHKLGMSPRAEAIPLTIEAQYVAGFNWARQFSLRAVNRLGDAASVGIAIEGAQTTFSARNAPASFVMGQPGGSTLNATAMYSTDYSPDLVLKLAIDPKGFGHWELKAIGREMRDRVVNPATPGSTHNTISTAYGLGFGVYVPIMAGKRDIADIGLSGLAGRGIGRYGSAQLPDATVGADSALVPISALHGLLAIETHPRTNLDVYTYAGAEYADRTAFVNGAGQGVGYGSPLNNNTGCETEMPPTNQNTPNSGACSADTRAIWQGTVGFWYRFYKGAAGTAQWGMQYSYTSRNTWSGQGLQPQATNHMAFTSFRYVLP